MQHDYDRDDHLLNLPFLIFLCHSIRTNNLNKIALASLQRTFAVSQTIFANHVGCHAAGIVKHIRVFMGM